MTVVSDTSPLNYLLLIGADRVLPSLFGRVIAPPEVLAEMQHAKAPSQVSAWARQPPAWLEVCTPREVASFPGLGPGESAAIALAQQRHADALLIDERDGRARGSRMTLHAGHGMMDAQARRDAVGRLISDNQFPEIRFLRCRRSAGSACHVLGRPDRRAG